MEEVVAAVVPPITLSWIVRKLISDERDAVQPCADTRDQA
jgi:hypothetical protein